VRSVIVAGIALLMAVPPQGQTLPSDSVVRSWLDARVANGYSAGIVVGLVTTAGTRTVSVGRADVAASTPLDATAIFEIGSVTKVFTTLLFADMVRRGEVALDDPVAMYLPTSVTIPSRKGTPITLLDLATASSGLPGSPTNLQPANPADPYADYSVPQLYSSFGIHAFARSWRTVRVLQCGHGTARSRLGTSRREE